MAFVYEIIPSEDIEYVRSLGIKDCTGYNSKIFLEGKSRWCVDRNRQVFLTALGGGYKDMPYFWVLWYENCEIIIETSFPLLADNEGRRIRKILAINVPQKCHLKKEEICNFIAEAFSAICKHHNSSTITEFHCEPEIKER